MKTSSEDDVLSRIERKVKTLMWLTGLTVAATVALLISVLMR